MSRNHYLFYSWILSYRWLISFPIIFSKFWRITSNISSFSTISWLHVPYLGLMLMLKQYLSFCNYFHKLLIFLHLKQIRFYHNLPLKYQYKWHNQKELPNRDFSKSIWRIFKRMEHSWLHHLEHVLLLWLLVCETLRWFFMLYYFSTKRFMGNSSKSWNIQNGK